MMNVTSAEETAATAVTISLFACVLSMTAIITSMCTFQQLQSEKGMMKLDTNDAGGPTGDFS